jgi:hypothetical protein
VAAQAKIKKQMRLYAAMQEARKDANAFLSALAEGHDDTHPYAPSDLEKLAKAKGFVVKTTEPFDEKRLQRPRSRAEESLHFSFSPCGRTLRTIRKSPSSMLLPRWWASRRSYVAGLQKRFPSQLQTLAAVRDQVLKDYRDSKALDWPRTRGKICRRFASGPDAGQIVRRRLRGAKCQTGDPAPVRPDHHQCAARF